MFGICFKKGSPSVFVMHYRNGVVLKQGPGLSFWYFSPTSTIVDIPLSSSDVPFIFHEMTLDFQEVTVQGQLTYRISDPIKLAPLLDFSVRHNDVYIGDAIERLSQRLINTTQSCVKSVTQRLVLASVLTSSQEIVAEVLAQLRASQAIAYLGVEIIGLAILSLKPTPEMSRALEADAREALQQRADQAIYTRRNAAVEEERRIKESELNTEIAVEAKRRDIRQAKMAADIAIEEQRSQLIDRRVENERKDADSRAYALESVLRPLQNADWRTLLAVAAKGADPRFAISLAFQELAQNAGRIGQLNVTPDLLKSLLTSAEK